MHLIAARPPLLYYWWSMESPRVPGKIFINYRRGDDAGNTGRLFDRLQETFAPDQLFMDVDSIKPGLDFVKVLDEQVAQCDVLLAVIGKGWIDARDEIGGRRLDDDNDFVRVEIEAALKQDKRVIPVLVGDARMPRESELPDSLKPFARRNAVRLTHERFRTDTLGLIHALQEALGENERRRREQAEETRRRAHESTPSQRGGRDGNGRRGLKLVIGVAVAGLGAVLAIVQFAPPALDNKSPPPPSRSAPAPSAPQPADTRSQPPTAPEPAATRPPAPNAPEPTATRPPAPNAPEPMATQPPPPNAPEPEDYYSCSEATGTIEACSRVMGSGYQGEQLAWLYFNRGKKYRERRDLDRAIADFTAAIKLDPKNQIVYAYRCNARYTKGEINGAISDCTSAIALDPRDAASYYNRGLAKRAGGDKAGGDADIAMARRINPNIGK